MHPTLITHLSARKYYKHFCDVDAAGGQQCCVFVYLLKGCGLHYSPALVNSQNCPTCCLTLNNYGPV